MTAPVDVLAVMDREANRARSREYVDQARALEAARAAVAELIEAFDGLEQAYCRAGSPLDSAERTEDRKRLIAARAAIARVKGGAA